MNRLSQSHPSIFNVFAASQEEEEYEEEKTKLNSDQNEYSPIKSEGKRKDRMLSTIDVLISLFVVNPCVVGMWRAIWMYMDLYTAYYPVMSSFALATLLHIISAYKQESVEKFFERRGSSKSVNVFYKVFKRLYIYFFAVVSVTQWRGGWFIFDYLIGLTEILPTWGNSRPALSFAAVCLLCLFSLKACINLMSTPFVIILDRNKQTFTIPTRFKHDASEQTALYILDCIFSVVVIGTLVVFVWRGGWVLLDLLIFPENFSLSSWTSLVLGYILVAVAFLAQPVMKWICDRLTGAARLLVADAFLIFSLVGTLNVWRGLWAIANLYILPENLELSCWITHWVCLTVLILLGCSNSLLVRGVYIDAEEPAGECVIFPCHYLRIILQSESQKKLNSKLQLEDVEKKNKELDQSKGNNIVNHCPNSCTLDINHKSEICENDVSNQIKH